jgi:tRNA (guanine-N7-)-methyltransferase
MRDIILPGRLPWPTNWGEIFGRAAPLVIEIGFGNGEFLLDFARRRPHQNILGLEIALPSLRKAERKIKRLGLNNAMVIQSQAKTALWALCSHESIAEIYINFPDPWPKERHHDRRLINERFLHLAATRMEAGGLISAATDDPGYAEWIRAAFAESPYFDNPDEVDYLTEDLERLRTKYEQKALADGRSCYYFKRQRRDVSVPNIFPVPVELPMPHAIVSSPVSLEEIGRQFEPVSYTNDATSVRLSELYRSTFHEALLVDAYLNEEPLQQRIMLVITRRMEGDYLIHLHEVGFPRSTPGIHYAVLKLAQWLTGLHSDGKIVSQKLAAEVFETGA